MKIITSQILFGLLLCNGIRMQDVETTPATSNESTECSNCDKDKKVNISNEKKLDERKTLPKINVPILMDGEPANNTHVPIPSLQNLNKEEASLNEENVIPTQSPTLQTIIPLVLPRILENIKRVEKGAKHISCTCGVFDTAAPTELSRPIFTKDYHNFNYESKYSEEACRKLCIAMAETAGNRTNSFICHHVNNANKITAYMSCKVSGHENEKWIYSGLSIPKPICCKSGQLIAC